MSCCSQTRKQTTASSPTPDEKARLEYTGSNQIRITIPDNGNEYRFSPELRFADIPFADVRPLLRTGLFRRA